MRWLWKAIRFIGFAVASLGGAIYLAGKEGEAKFSKRNKLL